MPSRLIALFSISLFYVTIPTVGILLAILAVDAGSFLLAIPAVMYVSLSLLISARETRPDVWLVNSRCLSLTQTRKSWSSYN